MGGDNNKLCRCVLAWIHGIRYVIVASWLIPFFLFSVRIASILVVRGDRFGVVTLQVRGDIQGFHETVMYSPNFSRLIP